MKVLLIINPYATSVNTTARNAAIAALEAHHDVTVEETTERGHATELARKGVEGGCQAVVVLGGDGTVNEAANGMIGSEVVLAPLPGGSTNVFARTVGAAKKVKKAAPQVSAALSRQASRPMALGSVNGRYFLFHVGMGFDAAVVAQVEARSHLKRKIGQAIFVWAAFATWFRHYDHTRPRFSMQFEDGVKVDDGYFCVCLNTNPYTYFGVRPLNLSFDTGPDRGLVTVTIRSLRVLTLLRLVGSTLGRGKTVRRHSKVDYHTDLKSFTVAGHGPFPYQADGDYLGEAELLEFKHETGLIKLVDLSS